MEDYKYTNTIQKTANTLIKKAEARKQRPQQRLFMNTAILGTYGWHICTPVILGLVIGHIMDKYVPLPPMSWTFNCVLIGFILGIYNANKWANQTGHKETVQARQKQIQKLNKGEKNVRY